MRSRCKTTSTDPIPAWSAAASLGIHALVAATVLALEAWWLLGIEPPEFGGKRNVVQIELAFSATQPSAAEATVAPISTDSPIADPPAEPLISRDADLPNLRIEPTLDAVTHIDAELSPPEESRDRPDLPLPQHRSPPNREPTPERVAHSPLPRSAAPAPSAPQTQAMQVAGTDDQTPPDFSGNRKPAYPVAAYRQGIEGEVLLRLWINDAGRVNRVEVERTSGHAVLDRAAVEAVRTWRGRPARRQGQAVATVELLPIQFVLKR